jgi:hypothetical protein
MVNLYKLKFLKAQSLRIQLQLELNVLAHDSTAEDNNGNTVSYQGAQCKTR